MKHAEDWIKSCNGAFQSTIASVDIHDIKAIQHDAMQECAEIVRDRLYFAGRKPEAEFACDAILQRMKELK